MADAYYNEEQSKRVADSVADSETKAANDAAQRKKNAATGYSRIANYLTDLNGEDYDDASAAEWWNEASKQDIYKFFNNDDEYKKWNWAQYLGSEDQPFSWDNFDLADAVETLYGSNNDNSLSAAVDDYYNWFLGGDDYSSALNSNIRNSLSSMDSADLDVFGDYLSSFGTQGTYNPLVEDMAAYLGLSMMDSDPTKVDLTGLYSTDSEGNTTYSSSFDDAMDSLWDYMLAVNYLNNYDAKSNGNLMDNWFMEALQGLDDSWLVSGNNKENTDIVNNYHLNESDGDQEYENPNTDSYDSVYDSNLAWSLYNDALDNPENESYISNRFVNSYAPKVNSAGSDSIFSTTGDKDYLENIAARAYGDNRIGRKS